MSGMDRHTGRLLEGWPHVIQSIEAIVSTPIGQRIMREWFGSPLTRLLGENLTQPTFMRFVMAVAIAVDLWEPRFKVRRAAFAGTPEDIRSGVAGFALVGDYRPRALSGDFSI